MARWKSCNILFDQQGLRQLWQFSGGARGSLITSTTKLPEEPLPPKLILKDWQTLFQPRLNVAWLPPEQVFLRALQLPAADATETRSMVELQLEKLSPVPVTQLVWSFQTLPQTDPQMQTVIVIMASRNHVENFLGRLEDQDYLADRLELSFVDQLTTTDVRDNGVWIYPGIGGQDSCLVAWWFDGVLQNISLIYLPSDETRGALLQNQLAQMVWAGELEGWLSGAPKYHLVAEGETAEVWKTFFDADQNVECVAPAVMQDLASRTAKRVSANSIHTNLLPPEYTARYRQTFVDRLWMRGLGALIVLYLVGVMIYLGMVQYAQWQLGGLQEEVAALSSSYTNTLQMKEQVKVLQDQVDLQWAALECYRAVARNLPAELTLDSFALDRGRKLILTGTASGSDISRVNDFNEALRKTMDKNGKQPLFSKVMPPNSNPKPGGGIGWTFACELQRTDAE